MISSYSICTTSVGYPLFFKITNRSNVLFTFIQDGPYKVGQQYRLFSQKLLGIAMKPLYMFGFSNVLCATFVVLLPFPTSLHPDFIFIRTQCYEITKQLKLFTYKILKLSFARAICIEKHLLLTTRIFRIRFYRRKGLLLSYKGRIKSSQHLKSFKYHLLHLSQHGFSQWEHYNWKLKINENVSNRSSITFYQQNISTIQYQL